jgi:hypothetical protein
MADMFGNSITSMITLKPAAVPFEHHKLKINRRAGIPGTWTILVPRPVFYVFIAGFSQHGRAAERDARPWSDLQPGLFHYFARCPEFLPGNMETGFHDKHSAPRLQKTLHFKQ